MELKADALTRFKDLEKGDVVELESGTRYLVDPVSGAWRKLPRWLKLPPGIRVVKRGAGGTR